MRQTMRCRWVVAVMICIGQCVNYMMRGNISVAIIAMVPANPTNDSLNWTSLEKANVLGAYYWGYICGCLVGGRIAEVLGPRLTIVISVLGSVLCTFVSPAASKFSPHAMLVVRIVLGVLGGFSFPTMHYLISRWAVPTERGKFIGAIMTGNFGTFVGWTICGLVIEPWGWEWGFHVFGIISSVWVVLWWALVYDSPGEHPRITAEEKDYICEGIKIASSGEKKVLPYKTIMFSTAVWSQVCFHFGNTWGLYFVLTVGPSYIANALGFGISSTGLLSAMIYLARAWSAMACGALGDYFLKRSWMSVSVQRKGGSIFSHMLPGIILIIIAQGFSAPVALSLLILAMLFAGATTVTSVANVHDLTKHFAGTLTGISSGVGSIAGVVAPLVTAYFTKNDETDRESWQPVFYIGASLYVLSALQFIVIGSTDRQPWDSVENQNKEAL